MALPRKNRLIGKKNFDKVFQEGKTVKGSFLFIKVMLNNQENSRFSVIVSSKIYKNAVSRNSVKRILGELIRSEMIKFKKHYDVAVIIKVKAEEKMLKNDLTRLFLML